MSGNPNLKWMMTGGTPILGHLHMYMKPTYLIYSIYRLRNWRVSRADPGPTSTEERLWTMAQIRRWFTVKNAVVLSLAMLRRKHHQHSIFFRSFGFPPATFDGGFHFTDLFFVDNITVQTANRDLGHAADAPNRTIGGGIFSNYCHAWLHHLPSHHTFTNS